MNEEFVFEAPKIIQPEFRLYHDDNGNVLFYSSENVNHPHKYIVIDAMTYAASRPDVQVIDGKVVRKKANKFTSKYVKSNEGIKCLSDDINIIATNEKNITTWKFEVYEIE
jgi:hypothetical protein